MTVSVLQNVYAEEHGAPGAAGGKVDQYDSVDLMYQALNSGRADAAATDMSSAKWFMLQNPDQYVEAAMAGIRRPIPAPSRRAISNSCISSTSPSTRR